MRFSIKTTKKSKKTGADAISTLLVFICILSAVFPKLTIYIGTPFLCVGCEILWFVLNTATSPSLMKCIINRNLYMFPCIAFALILPLIGDNISIANRYGSILIALLFGTIAFQFYKEKKQLKTLEVAIKCAAPFFLYTLINSIMIGSADPWALRRVYISGDDFISTNLLLRGAGGYEFVYMLLLLVITATSITIRHKQTKLIKLSNYIFIALGSLCILLSNFTTAILLLCTGVALVFINSNDLKHHKKKIIIYPLCFAVMFFFLWLFQGAISQLVMSILPQDGRVFIILQGNSSDFFETIVNEFYTDRIPFLKISLQSILHSPLLGNAAFISGLDNNVYSVISNHSFALDSVALYGCLLGIIIIQIMISPLLTKHFSDIKENIPVICIWILILLLNNASYGTVIAVTIIIPYVLYLTGNKDVKKS